MSPARPHQVLPEREIQQAGQCFLRRHSSFDRPTTGVVLFARTSKGLERMNKAFKERQTQKTYWAVVEGQLRGKNDLKHFLKKNSKNNKAIVFRRPEEGAKEARLSYNVLKTGTIIRWSKLSCIPVVTIRSGHNFLP